MNDRLTKEETLAHIAAQKRVKTGELGDACANCAYAVESAMDGLCCHRHAPARQTGGEARWPMVSSSDWCGEYNRKP